MSSAIPAGTRLLGLTIKDGVATVDLSSEFESGGGSASATIRLGQVVYTLTQFPTVKSVVFQIDGRTVTRLRQRGHRPRRSGRPGRLPRPPAVDLRRPAGLRRGDRQPRRGSPARLRASSRRRSGSTLLDGERPARSPTSRSMAACMCESGAFDSRPSSTTSRRRSGARSGSGPLRPRTAVRSAFASIRSGSRPAENAAPASAGVNNRRHSALADSRGPSAVRRV